MEQGWAWCGEEFVDPGVGDLVANQSQFANQGPGNEETIPQVDTDTFQFSNYVEFSSTRDHANRSNSPPFRGFSLFDEWGPNYFDATGHELTNPEMHNPDLQNTVDTQHQYYEDNAPFTQGFRNSSFIDFDPTSFLESVAEESMVAPTGNSSQEDIAPFTEGFGNSSFTDFDPNSFLESVAEESMGAQIGSSSQEGTSGPHQTISAPDSISTEKRVPSQLSTTPKSPEEAKDILDTPITAADISTSWIIEKTTMWLQKTKTTRELFCKNILDCGIKTLRKFNSLKQSWEEIDAVKRKKVCIRMYNFILIPDSIKPVYLKMNLYDAIKQKKNVNKTASSSVVPIHQNYRVSYEEINKSTARDLHIIKMNELRNKLDEYEKLIATIPNSLEDVQKMLNATIPYANLIDTTSDRMEIINWQQRTNFDMVYSVDRIIGGPRHYLEHITTEVPPFSEMNSKSQQIHTRIHNWLLFTEEIKAKILYFFSPVTSQDEAQQGRCYQTSTSSNFKTY
ncbi:hypothetical protein B9Z55_023347 [Caenorhabditis nigoni]|uniref:CUT domain-containing protein n=1 Tax=Caenorhabditis nigoni TaxID=1611254 RepID=A0A2G5SPR9_9PELO|nr:hypothetical protein B9Z55_023347 [Caenorhabditis nigoni]